MSRYTDAEIRLFNKAHDIRNGSRGGLDILAKPERAEEILALEALKSEPQKGLRYFIDYPDCYDS